MHGQQNVKKNVAQCCVALQCCVARYTLYLSGILFSNRLRWLPSMSFLLLPQNFIKFYILTVLIIKHTRLFNVTLYSKVDGEQPRILGTCHGASIFWLKHYWSVPDQTSSASACIRIPHHPSRTTP